MDLMARCKVKWNLVQFQTYLVSLYILVCVSIGSLMISDIRHWSTISMFPFKRQNSPDSWLLHTYCDVNKMYFNCFNMLIWNIVDVAWLYFLSDNQLKKIVGQLSWLVVVCCLLKGNIKWETHSIKKDLCLMSDVWQVETFSLLQMVN